jgi:hypothetical protein
LGSRLLLSVRLFGGSFGGFGGFDGKSMMSFVGSALPLLPPPGGLAALPPRGRTGSRTAAVLGFSFTVRDRSSDGTTASVSGTWPPALSTSRTSSPPRGSWTRPGATPSSTPARRTSVFGGTPSIVTTT